jgi:hypothetical protein
MNYALHKIKAGINNTAECKWPGTDITIRIRLLTNQDILESSLAADKTFRDCGSDVSVQNIKIYEAEKDIQHLYRATSDLDGNSLAPNIAEFRKLLTVSDKEWLIERYNALDAECNPSADTMSDEDFDFLVESVKKNPAAVSKLSSIYTLKRLARFLASAPVSLQTGNGST